MASLLTGSAAPFVVSPVVREPAALAAEFLALSDCDDYEGLHRFIEDLRPDPVVIDAPSESVV